MQRYLKLGFSLVLGASCCLQAADADRTFTADRSQELVMNAPALSGINAQLNVSRSTLVTLNMPGELAGGFSVEVPIEGEWVMLDITPHSTRAPSYRIFEVAGDVYTEVEPGPAKTFRGTVRSMKDAIVAGGLQDTGFEARIMMPDGRNYWIEPAHKYSNLAPLDAFVVYRSADSLPSNATCACDDIAWVGEGGGQDGVAPRGSGDCGGLCVAELGCDADVEFFNIYGSVSAVQDRINLVINTMNPQYESQCGITHLITTILVRTTEPDPYSSNDAGGLLNQFSSHWNGSQGAIQRDVAELFTGKNISGSVIGIAALGVICTSGGYNVVEQINPLACATDLSAHELGHNWNATHTSETMNSGLTCANNFNGTSISQITNHRNSRSCLDAAETGRTTLPFSDEFPSTVINGANWTGVDGAAINADGINEPSPTLSLNIQSSNEIRSALIDTSDRREIDISYSVEEGGTGNAPENGEDLIVEYRNNINQWVELTRELGAGGAESNYTARNFTIGGDALHPDFRLRFRGTSPNANADDWFIDNVNIDGPIATPPQPFTLLSPSNGQEDISLSGFLFDWEDSVNATTYTLQVDNSASFPSPEITVTGIVGSEANVDTSVLNASTIYFWRVFAESLDGTQVSIPSASGFRTSIVNEEFGTIELRVVTSDDMGTSGNNGPITLAPGETQVDLYVQARVMGDPDATGIVTFDGIMLDDGSGSISQAPLTITEATGLPFPGLDLDGRAGMFPSYRGVIGTNNTDPGNGLLNGQEWQFLPLNIEADGNGEGLGGVWSNVYKFNWSTPTLSPRTVTIELLANLGGYQRSAANGGLADAAPILGSTFDITLELPGFCPCDIDGNTVVDVSDLLTFLSFWFPLDLAADYNNDTIVDVTDLLEYLGCWFPASSGAPCP